MILYVIQAHKGLEQLVQLCKMLAGPSAKILCLIDEEGEIDANSALAAKADLPAAVALRFVPSVTWGGISQVKTLLEAMDFAERNLGKWDWFVNLSGECLPLTGSSALQAHLNARYREDILSHVNFYDEVIRDFAPSATWKCKEFGRDVPRILRDFNIGRARLRADRSEVSDYEVSRMVLDWQDRGAMRSSEIGDKRLALSVLTALELEKRREFCSSFKLYGGRAWFAFHRSIVSLFLKSKMTSILYDNLRSFICVDEIFFQTLLRNVCKDTDARNIRHNLHHGQGAPYDVTDDDLDNILKSPSWFVRKVSYNKCPKIMEHLRVRLTEGT